MADIKGCFLSDSSEWRTPAGLYHRLDEMFHFDLDPCATHENHLCDWYFTKDDDGLKQEWAGNVFVNPPYGRELPKWVKKAYEESLEGRCRTIVMLIPARPDTRYWQDIIFPYAAAICYIKGRLKFNDGNQGAPFPSAIVVFKSDTLGYWR